MIIIYSFEYLKQNYYIYKTHYTIIIKIVLYCYVHHCFIQNSRIKKTFTTNGQNFKEVSQTSAIKAVL
jgi:hypothetical protein